ncbi:DUF554 domain-containing protein [Treponema rectale]|uniref:DUF554 domain-containing protein n=1 Tax=Treponema rectale TaxID=744512 RepID=A0A840SG96_9SPIR|nr:DUF554 domain-containing protein [Treponema rectale]MBB5219178.1 hypothetical protein [Treponema rectale]QOS40925.1 DUF554 domain-containing protein [Treponema rectale]
MIAVFVNCATVLAGSIIGLLFAKKIPQKITDAIQLACGLVSFIMGIQMAFKYQNVVYLALALILGGITGTLLDIDGKILAFGKLLERIFIKNKSKEQNSISKDTAGQHEEQSAPSFETGRPKKNFAYGFLNASVLFCVGAMAIVGSFKAGIEHDYSIIFLKSILDGFIAIGFTVAMGVGTAFSIITIFLYQGCLTLLSVLIAPYVTEQMIAELTGSGGALIILIGINLMGIKKIKTADYLPAVLFSVIFVLCEPIIKGIISG